MVNNRIQAFDVAKAIAIFAVILTHCAGRIGGMQDLRFFIETFYLSMFFVLSGYFTNLSKLSSLSIKENMLEKFKRLIVPFITIIMISFIIDIIKVGSFDFWELFVDDAKGGYWFIYVLFLFNIIFCVQYRIILKWNISNIVGQCAIFVFPWIIIVLLCTSLSQSIIACLSLYSCRRYYLFFIMGWFLKSTNMLPVLGSRILRFAISIGYILMAVIFVKFIKDVDTNTDFFFWFFTNVLGSCFWLTVLLSLEDKVNDFPAFLLSIGQNSLGIYLYHYFFLFVIVIFPPGINMYVLLLFASIIILLATYCLIRLIIKNNLLSKILLGNSK